MPILRVKRVEFVHWKVNNKVWSTEVKNVWNKGKVYRIFRCKYGRKWCNKVLYWEYLVKVKHYQGIVSIATSRIWVWKFEDKKAPIGSSRTLYYVESGWILARFVYSFKSGLRLNEVGRGEPDNCNASPNLFQGLPCNAHQGVNVSPAQQSIIYNEQPEAD